MSASKNHVCARNQSHRYALIAVNNPAHAISLKSYAAETRARQSAKATIQSAYGNPKQREFIDFILEKYMEDGVRELATAKMRSLIELKYNTISDAAQELGSPQRSERPSWGFSSICMLINNNR